MALQRAVLLGTIHRDGLGEGFRMVAAEQGRAPDVEIDAMYW